MTRIRICIQFLLFLVYFQFLSNMKFYFRFMLVFVSVFQGVRVESIEGFIKIKLKPKLKDAELIIRGSFLFLIYLFHDDACFKFGGVNFFIRLKKFSHLVFGVFSISPLIKKILMDEVAKMSIKGLGSCDVNDK